MRDSLNFLVIGAQKAGTTALFEYLRTHPDVYMPTRKEEPFFHTDYPSVPYKSWTEYMATVFGGAPANAIWGKVSPQYMIGGLFNTSEPTQSQDHPCPERLIPERIYRIMPDVRLVAILREPVARAISAHRMQVVMFSERRSFDNAIEDLLIPEKLVAARRSLGKDNTYVILGEYARILQGYYDVFSSEQILVVFTEELEHNSESVMRRVFNHIRADPSFVPSNLGTRYFALRDRGRVRWLKPRRWEQAVARRSTLKAGWRKLPQPARTAIGERYWSWSNRVLVWTAINSGDTREAAACSPRTRERLEQHYAGDVGHLRELIGRHPPWGPSTSHARGYDP
jgi:Sulfotransferase domain